jgi:hypothetical protein
VVITPALVLDGGEKWRPCAVETIPEVGATIDGQPVDLDALPPKGGRMDFPKNMTQPDVPCVGYHRIVTGGSLWWHQFWVWWLYNPKVYAGFGAHEGDWEMVQLGCRDPEGNVPILITFSQHGGGEKKEFWSTERLVEGKPAVYVARDSHANYPTVHRDVTDVADGKLGEITIEWREFGPWTDWPGQWGNSQNSPGPLSTRRAWTAPHAYHSQARG